MMGYEFYPWIIQLWIWSVAAVVGISTVVVLRRLWWRPLQEARLVIEETDAYRTMAVMDGKRRISKIVQDAAADVMNNSFRQQMKYMDCFGDLDPEKAVGIEVLRNRTLIEMAEVEDDFWRDVS